MTFTAHVVKASDASNVTSGAVTFREGATVLAASVALNGSGQAAFTTSALAEGSHVITAYYGGVPAAFNIPSGSLVQVVDSHTVVNGTEFCNPGPLTINASGAATPYPAHIFVAGLAGTISNVTARLAGLSHPSSDDVDLMLVGPTGAKLVPMSDVGGSNAVSGVTLTLDDAAANQVPDATALATGTFRPTFQAPSADAFPAPAPVSPGYAAPDGSATFASTFAGTDPNGTWSVYVANDGGAASGSFGAGVCLTFTLNAPDLSIAKTHSGALAQG